jgi:hypothetical protein
MLEQLYTQIIQSPFEKRCLKARLLSFAIAQSPGFEERLCHDNNRSVRRGCRALPPTPLREDRARGVNIA